MVRDQIEARDALGQGFQGDRRLDYREAIAETEMNAPTEGNVGAGILAVDVEGFGLIEQRLVVIGRAEREEYLRAAGVWYPVNFVSWVAPLAKPVGNMLKLRQSKVSRHEKWVVPARRGDGHNY